MQIDAVISAAGRIHSQIPKVAKVPRVPGRDAVCHAIGRRLRRRTGERGQIELVPLLVGERDPSSKGVDAVVACFVVVACEEVWLASLVALLRFGVRSGGSLPL
jgi:hypothetical protein